MKYINKCNIPVYSKSECKHRVIVNKYKTYQAGFNGTETRSTSDGTLVYCNFEGFYCPNKVKEEIEEKQNEC